MTTRSASIFIMFLLAAAGVSSLTAHAQVSARPDPGDPGTPAIADKYDSAFNGYKQFREQPVRSWKDANQEVADNPGMGSMANMPGMNMPGMNMPGMNSKAAAGTGAATSGAMPGMAGMPAMSMPRMGSKAAMPAMNMPGMDSKGAAAAHGKSGSAMPRMGAMPAKGSMPGMNMAGAEAQHGHGGVAKSGGSMPGMGSAGTASKDEHAHGAGAGGPMPGMAMPGMGSKSDEAESAILTGTGVVRAIDKPGARIKLTHDPIEAVSWPRMTIVFRVKNASLVDQVKQGDKVKFVLTKSSTGYVISDIQNVASSSTNQTK